MKTALLKTTLWDDNDFYELNIDTKLLYLLLLSCPERGVGSIYKIPNRIIAARSGLNIDQVNFCKKQLEEKKMMSFYGDFVLIRIADNIEAKKGRFTQISVDRERKEIPRDVYEHFRSLLDPDDGTGSSVSLEQVKVEGNVKVEEKVKYTEKDVQLTELLMSQVKENWAHTDVRVNPPGPKEYDEMRKMRERDKRDPEQILAVIMWCQQDDFWKQNIRSVYKLRSKFDDLLIRGTTWFNQKKKNRIVEV